MESLKWDLQFENKELHEAHAKLIEVQKTIEELQSKGLIQEWELAGTNTLGDVIDAVCDVSCVIAPKLDDRPAPFSVYDSYGYILEFITDKEEKRQEERAIRQFAEVGCLSQKYRNGSAAYIGKYEFSYSELVKFRNWATDVIEWHKANGHPTERNPLSKQ